MSISEYAPDMKTLASLGYTLEEIGGIYGVSRERIRQILAEAYPHFERSARGAAIRKCLDSTQETLERLEDAKAKWGLLPVHQRTAIEQAQVEFFKRKKQNASSSKHSWEIKMTDVEWPTHCPVLGIEIDWFASVRAENSPSLDRIDNHVGYLPGNVAIISYRANRIKNDGSLADHKNIVRWMEKYPR